MTDLWDVQQYEKFRLERLQPGLDLIAMVQPKEGMRCVDLGCGTGELTAMLLNKLPNGTIVGLDNSPNMLARATENVSTGMMFVQEDIAYFERPNEFDLVFSNAALHWIPDHEALFRRLVNSLRPDGQLVVQMPMNGGHPAFVAAHELAATQPYEPYARNRKRQTVLDPAEYAVLLHSLGLVEIEVNMRVYLHLLESREQVVEWLKGTFLRDFQKVMPPELFESFVDDFRSVLRERLPDVQPFPFTYKRVLVRGVRTDS